MSEQESMTESSDTECPTCGDTFSSERGLSIHHTKAHGEPVGEPEYVCSECGKECGSNVTMLKHIRGECPNAGVSCPECGKVFLKEVGMKQHCSQEHGVSLRGELKECKLCGEEFRAEAAYSTIFCGEDCHQKWESARHKENRPVITCDGCGDEFEVVPAREDTARFCSTKCREKRHTLECEYCSGDYEVPEHKLDSSRFCSITCQWKQIASEQEYERTTLECAYCGSGYDVKPSHADGSRFCSRDCKHKWQSENERGEDHPAWKGGYDPYYGPNWLEQRRTALKRDQCRCQICGDTPLDLDREPSVHHIKPVRWFKENVDDSEWWVEANDLDNLVTLCREHHKKVEGWHLRPDTR